MNDYTFHYQIKDHQTTLMQQAEQERLARQVRQAPPRRLSLWNHRPRPTLPAPQYSSVPHIVVQP